MTIVADRAADASVDPVAEQRARGLFAEAPKGGRYRSFVPEIGSSYGDLTVLSVVRVDRHGSHLLLRCNACGREIVRLVAQLNQRARAGRHQSCLMCSREAFRGHRVEQSDLRMARRRKRWDDYGTLYSPTEEERLLKETWRDLCDEFGEPPPSPISVWQEDETEPESQCYFGADPEYTLEETGKKFGVTRERLRQIEAKALRKMAAQSGELFRDRQEYEKLCAPPRPIAGTTYVVRLSSGSVQHTCCRPDGTYPPAPRLTLMRPYSLDSAELAERALASHVIARACALLYECARRARTPSAEQVAELAMDRAAAIGPAGLQSFAAIGPPDAWLNAVRRALAPEMNFYVHVGDGSLIAYYRDLVLASARCNEVLRAILALLTRALAGDSPEQIAREIVYKVGDDAARSVVPWGDGYGRDNFARALCQCEPGETWFEEHPTHRANVDAVFAALYKLVGG